MVCSGVSSKSTRTRIASIPAAYRYLDITKYMVLRVHIPSLEDNGCDCKLAHTQASALKALAAWAPISSWAASYIEIVLEGFATLQIQYVAGVVGFLRLGAQDISWVQLVTQIGLKGIAASIVAGVENLSIA